MTISMLGRARRHDIVTEPFPHIVVEDALPADYYRQLAAEYPSFKSIAGEGPHGNNELYLRSAYEIPHMPDVSPAWREFFAYHISRDFYAEIVALFGDHIRAAHPAFEASLGRRLEELSVGIRPPGKAQDPEATTHDAKLDVQFGCNSPVLEKSSVRTAHVDSKYKLLASLLYFRQAGDDSAGGELELYRYDPAAAQFDKRHQLIRGDFAVARTVPYRPNMLVMWVNSPRALHGVSPRHPTSIPRRYVNIICETYHQQSGLFSLPGLQPQPA